MKPAAQVASAAVALPGAYRSKTLATWAALIGGAIGLHRFYLHGWRDPLGWLLPWPTLVGALGVLRMRQLGADDQLAWAMIPLLGLALATTMLTAIVYGLTPDDKWNARFNPDGPAHQTGWSTVIGVILALVIGAGILIATIAFTAQRFFEYQIDGVVAPSRRLAGAKPPDRLAGDRHQPVGDPATARNQQRSIEFR